MLEILRPSATAPRVEEVDLEELRRRGFRCLILDLDNTLVPFGARRVEARVRRWLEEARRKGFRLVILSNNGRRRVAALARRLDVPCVPAAYKPLRIAYRRALRLTRARPEETIVIGDQLFTDVLGGRLAGISTLLVAPRSRAEFVGTRLVRLLERLVLGRLGCGVGREGRRLEEPPA